MSLILDFFFSQIELVTPRVSPSMGSAQVFKMTSTFYLSFAKESVTVSHFTSPQAT